MSEVIFQDKKVRKLLNNFLKKSKAIASKKRDYVTLLSSVVFADTMDHFKKRRDEKGKWADWSPNYKLFLKRKKRLSNKKLQYTGTLRQNMMPIRTGGNSKIDSRGILWMNKTKYAAAHNYGYKKNNIPQREFMWLSKSALEDMSKKTLLFLKGK